MDITCPLCNQPDPLYSKKRQVYICEDCGHEFAPEEPFNPQRIFISYGHDEHTSLALQLRDDLCERGHEVWFDEERLMPSKDWEARIEEGLNWTAAGKPHAAVILLLTPHSVRRPEGFCLNEVARALMLRLCIIPLMVVESEPPLSICRIQWLDMRECIPIHEKKDLYEPRFQRLLKALEQEELDYEGLQSRLLRTLQPIEFSADLFKLLRDFTGRKWVFDEIDAWFKNPDGTKLFWLTGAPGVGKSALAAWVKEHRREVAAYHFCDINSEEKRNPAKLVCSIAYQLSTQLSEYQERLGRLDLESIMQEYHEAYTLFDKLLVQPLSEGYPAPDRTIVVLIDALDEATSRRQNEIVRLLSRSADKTPPWLRFLVTSRLEPEITSSFQALLPYILDTDRTENLADLRQYIITMIPDITEAQTEELLKRSEGVFLYISHVVAGIKEKTLDLEHIEDFPRGLGDVYQQFFDRQFGQDLAYYEEKIIPLLQPIIAAYEPLDRQFLKAVCSIEEDTELERCLNRLGSLFLLSGEGTAETVRPFHRSISDWITDRKSAGHFVVAAADGHRVLAEYCCQEYVFGVEALSPYTLRFLPAHLVVANRFGDLVGDKQTPGPLTDLRFIQAKCEAGLVYDLVNDYNLALAELPEFREEQEYLREHEKAMRAYNRALNDYAVKRYDYLQLCEKGLESAEPPYPELPKILMDEKRPPLPEENSEQAARLRHFANFISRCTEALATHPEETIPLAYNDSCEGPISIQAEQLLKCYKKPWFRRSPRPPAYPLRPLCLRTLEGHKGSVESVYVFPDGRRALSGSFDETLKLWDLESGSCLRTLEGHKGSVESVSISTDSRCALSGSRDKTLCYWDLKNGTCLRSLKGHYDSVNTVDIVPGGRFAVSGGVDKTLRYWDLENGTCLAVLEGHSGSVNSVSISPNGRCVLSGSEDNTLWLWDIENGHCLSILKGHSDSVESVSIAPDGRTAVSGSDDKTLRVWDLENATCLKILEGHKSSIWGVSITPDGRFAVSGSDDKTLRTWDLLNGTCMNILEGQKSSIWSVSITPDGKHAVSGGLDKILRVWDLKNSEHMPAIEGHKGSVWSIDISHNGRFAASGSGDRTIRIWDLKTFSCTHSLEGHSGSVSTVNITSDGKHVLSGGWDKTLRLWEIESGECLFTLEGHKDWIYSVSVTPDGRFAVSGSEDKTLRFWDLESGDCLFTMEGHEGSVRCLSITPDGKKAVSGGVDKTLRLWELEHGRCLLRLEGHSGSVGTVKVTPDGRFAVSGSEDNTLRLWDLGNGDCLHIFKGHNLTVKSVSVSPDGRYAVSGGDCNIFSSINDYALRVWDLKSGKCLYNLVGHSNRISSLIVTPDSKHLISGSLDKTLRFWDLNSGECIAIYCVGSMISSVKIGAASNLLICGTHDGLIHFLNPVNFSPLGPANITTLNSGEARCVYCGHLFTAPPSVISATNNKPDTNVEKEKLISACPLCGRKLKFNPF